MKIRETGFFIRNLMSLIQWSFEFLAKVNRFEPENLQIIETRILVRGLKHINYKNIENSLKTCNSDLKTLSTFKLNICRFF